MGFPVYVPVGPLKIHPHLLFETAAYAIAFRVYLTLRRRAGDALADTDRWWIIAAAAMGAMVGSKMLYWVEDPAMTLAHWRDLAYLMSGKTIVGALIGGLLAVELAKRVLRIERRTGDLFAVPLCMGIAIGRIGCFLTGLQDHTVGTPTSLPWGIDFGDGLSRHPAQLYEALFALALGVYLWRRMRRPFIPGDIFKRFMVTYFTFRLASDFLKPDVRVFFGLSSIQLASMLMLVYYSKDVLRWLSSTGRPLPAASGPASTQPAGGIQSHG